MPVIPIAAFLAGALLTLLLPICLLLAIVVWYSIAIRRVPSGREDPEAAAPSPPTDPTSTI